MYWILYITLLFGFFKKVKKVELDFKNLGTDMHSHILPGLDDGAQEIKDSIEMARKFVELGFTKLVATPHIMADYYRNTPERIFKSLDILNSALEKNSIPLKVTAAAEYYLDETFLKKITASKLLTFGNNYVLFELSYINVPRNLEETIKELLEAGYKPILAHPERYPYWHADLEHFHNVVSLGCDLQLNTISLTGYYGKQVRKAAEMLVDEKLVSFIGSDMHHLKHANALKEATHLAHVHELISSPFLKNKFL